MNYTIHQLLIFCKVVECKSITRAAEELNMTQPAVSIQLKKFQEQFNLPLYEMHGKKLIITDMGKEVYESILEITEKLQLLEYKAKTTGRQITGKLKIASASTGIYVVPYFLSDYLKKYPQIDLKLDFTNRTNAIKSLLDRTSELAVVSLLPTSFAVNEEILIRNELVMVVKNGIDEKNLPMIFREKGSATRMLMEKYFLHQKYHLDARHKIELSSNEAVKQAVLAGLGISIVPLMSIKREIENGLVKIIPGEGLPIITHWRVIWLKNKKLSPAASAFVDLIKNTKNQPDSYHLQEL